MPVYEVTYDLVGAPPEEYAALRDFLKTLDSWHDEYSAWFVSYAGSDEDLYTLLQPFVGLRDRLTVVRVEQLTTKYKFGGFDWLKRHGVEVTPKS